VEEALLASYYFRQNAHSPFNFQILSIYPISEGDQFHISTSIATTLGWPEFQRDPD